MSNESAQAISDAFAGAVATAAASIVSVSARRRFPASGIVWSENVIVTADHVIEQEEHITVRLPDGSEVPATVAGRDAGSDIAVLRVEAGGLQPLQAAPPVRIGEPVFAVGRPGREPQASFGIVSTHGASWRTVSGGQVDGWVRAEVTMLPGFSGGPLVDLSGRLIGMNSSSLGRGGGLSIPVAALAPIVEALLKSGRLKRGYLGIGSQPVRLGEAQAAKLEGQQSGLLVIGVEPNSPAGGAGILVGDILVRMGEDRLEGTDDLQRTLGSASVGKATPVTIVRGGEPLPLTVTIGERA
jgi:S1-C subfamily serine protease